MNAECLKRNVVITNPQGFHMRPMAKFVQVATQYQSTVTLSRGDRIADGKSLLAMMASVLSLPGEEVTLEITGPDAREALDALVAVMEAPTEED